MKKIPIILTMSILTACQIQESTETTDSSIILNQLTNGPGNSKIWKVENAILENQANPNGLVISNLANIRDDEFVFSASGSDKNRIAHFNWKIRNEVRTNAINPEDALLDYYLSPMTKDITIQSNGEIISGDPNLEIVLLSENQVAIKYIKDLAQLRLELTPEIQQVFITPNSFQFNKIAELTGKGLEQAAGFTGSMANNSLFIAYKSLEGDFPERVVQYHITSGIFNSRDFLNSDFVTKELHIINGELKVVGGKYVNTYGLDLDKFEKDPISIPHNLTLTRFGSTVVDNEIYLFGGNLLVNATDSLAPKANEIYKHDQSTGLLNLVGKLPEPRYWAHGEIVDNKLFVFGGRQEFVSPVAEDDIFVWDASTKEVSTFKLPIPMHRTFTARYEHLIVVGGQREIPGTEPGSYEMETLFGLFNTHDNTFNLVPTSLNATGHQTIFGLTIVNSKLYILFGSRENTTFSIYEAGL